MLKSESFNVYITNLGEEGLDLGKLYDYDHHPARSEFARHDRARFYGHWRISRVKTPILILTGLGGVEDKVKGLGSGADDYMTKPFHKDELVARIHAIVRRSKGHAESVIRTGDLLIKLDTKTVEMNGSPVHLTPKEYLILELLSLRKGTILTKEIFLNHLYGGMDEPLFKIIDVFICKLRKKLTNASGGKDYIVNRVGRRAMYCVSQRSSGDRFSRLSRGCRQLSLLTEPFSAAVLANRLMRKSRGAAHEASSRRKPA